jgi:anti-anti-sigma regulatory factor
MLTALRVTRNEPVLDGHAKVVLDLKRLRFIDSSGWGAFISCLAFQ